MNIFCQHDYGKIIVGKSSYIDRGLIYDIYYIRTRAYKKCKLCGKKLILSEEFKQVFKCELEDFIEKYYIEGTGIIKEEYLLDKEIK